MPVSIELAAAFARASGERLVAAEQLVLAFPQLFGGMLAECDLAYRRSSRFLVAVARLPALAATPQVRARLQFWCARAGGLATSLGGLSPGERAIFDAHFDACDIKVKGAAPQMLPEAMGRIAGEAGVPANRQRAIGPSPTLAMDVGGPGWEGISFDDRTHRLFIPGAIAPPVGDELTLSLRLPRSDGPCELRASVAEVRGPESAGPSVPAGFTLALQSPPPHVLKALGRPAAAAAAGNHRAAPRYPVKAPVKVLVPPPPAPAPAAAPALARIEYANDQELAADYLENLSQGGAFVRTASPAPVGTRLALEMKLPGGVELRAPATVAFARGNGMGVKFELDADGEARLAAVIARISARPRRALVVGGDGVARRLLADALAARGFEVLTAGDANEGLRFIAEELLTLDLLITDVEMPRMDGEAFIRTIRQAGGEADLAIVAVSPNLDRALERRLEAVGADAVLDRSLGPELIGQAADAALEQKRAASDPAQGAPSARVASVA
jgi:uncharacterized protein (TIGR02266 family)